MPINRRMDKESVAHICNGILLSRKKEQNCAFAESQMDLETGIQSEVKEKNKYHIFNAYMWNLEKWYR